MTDLDPDVAGENEVVSNRRQISSIPRNGARTAPTCGTSNTRTTRVATTETAGKAKTVKKSNIA